MPITRLSENQVLFSDIFSVKKILTSRWFDVISENDASKLLINEEDYDNPIWNKLYEVFYNANLRTDIKRYLYEGTEPRSLQVRELILDARFHGNSSKFDNTFEWFAWELMKKEFSAFSASFWVELSWIIRPRTWYALWDYDAVSVLRNLQLAYLECKSGDYDHESIMKCYDRMVLLNAEFSIFFCIKNIDEEVLKWLSTKINTGGITAMHYLCSIANWENKVYEIANCYIMDISWDMVEKVRIILRTNAAKINQLHYGMSMDDDGYRAIGLEYQAIDIVRYS